MMSSVKFKQLGQFIECYVNRLYPYQFEELHYDYFTRTTYYACLQFCEWDRFTIRSSITKSIKMILYS